MKTRQKVLPSKVPEVTLTFWIVKILATTLGETGGDALSMSMNLGYFASTAIFAAIFAVAVIVQILAKKFHPVVYWTTIVATTTVGTTLADFLDRSLGIGYAGGSTILFIFLMGSLWIWHRALGSIAVSTVSSPKSEMFYWITIMFSQTLGTALGDWTADAKGLGLGYSGAAIVFGAMLAFIAAAYYRTKISRTALFWSAFTFTRPLSAVVGGLLNNISRTALFWSAFILTRPLGAVVGDFLDKPAGQGGLELSRYSASITLLLLIGICLLFFPHRPAREAH
jgi:uncharacterized membrane-anchored protein